MEKLLEEIQKAKAAWDDIADKEEAEGYSDAMLSIERGEAEGFYFGLRWAYIILNGHEPNEQE